MKHVVRIALLLCVLFASVFARNSTLGFERIYVIEPRRDMIHRQHMETLRHTLGLSWEYVQSSGSETGHTLIWRDIVSHGYASALILSDDIDMDVDVRAFCGDILDAFASSQFAWDLMYLGTGQVKQPELTMPNFARQKLQIEKRTFPHSKRGDERMVLVNRSQRFFAYAITGIAAQRLLHSLKNSTLSIENVHNDISVLVTKSGLADVAVTPPIIFQIPEYDPGNVVDSSSVSQNLPYGTVNLDGPHPFSSTLNPRHHVFKIEKARITSHFGTYICAKDLLPRDVKFYYDCGPERVDLITLAGRRVRIFSYDTFLRLAAKIDEGRARDGWLVRGLPSASGYDLFEIADNCGREFIVNSQDYILCYDDESGKARFMDECPEESTFVIIPHRDLGCDDNLNVIRTRRGHYLRRPTKSNGGLQLALAPSLAGLFAKQLVADKVVAIKTIDGYVTSGGGTSYATYEPRLSADAYFTILRHGGINSGKVSFEASRRKHYLGVYPGDGEFLRFANHALEWEMFVVQ